MLTIKCFLVSLGRLRVVVWYVQRRLSLEVRRNAELCYFGESMYCVQASRTRLQSTGVIDALQVAG